MSGGISSVTGFLAFNARKMEVFAVLCMFLQGLEPLFWCEVVVPERQWSHPLKENIHNIYFICNSKNQYFWRSLQDLRTKPQPVLLKSIVCSEIAPNESDHAQSRTGSCLFSHHSVVVWWILYRQPKLPSVFVLKLNLQVSLKPLSNQMNLEKEHVSLWPAIEC